MTDELRTKWSQRAKEHGRRSVIHLSVPADQFESATRYQEGLLFPLLTAQLASAPASILDYGCGCGRFCNGLLSATGATRYTGYDFCAELIDIANADIADPRATFESGEPRRFLARAGTFDLIWINSVLGGVPDAELPDLTRDICTCLASGGLMFVAEATSADISGYGFWRFRKEDDYESRFGEHGVTLRKIGAFKDIAGSHDVTAFAGRKDRA